MSIYLKNFGCPDKFTNDWKKMHVTKWFLLCAGMVMAVSGYYIGSSLIIFDGGHQMWILCALFWGSAGVCIVAYSVALVHLKNKFHRSLKYEEKINVASSSNFHTEDNRIRTQRDKQMPELLSTHCYKLKPFSRALNKDVTFKEKYIGSNGNAKGMYASYETTYEAETLNTSDGIERKVFNELSESPSYIKQTDFSYQFTKSFNAVADETSGSQKISSSLEESSFAKLIKPEDHTSQVQNEIRFKDISSDAHFVFKHQPEKDIKENIAHMFDKDNKIKNYFQISPSSFKCELFQDPYFCKTLCQDETMELVVESLSVQKSERSEFEKIAIEFTSFATLLLTDDLRSDIQQSYNKFLETEDPGTATDDVEDSDKKFWSKIPMKRSNSKLTKKRCEPIILKNPETVSKNEPDIHHWEKLSSALVSAKSGNESTFLTDRRTCRAPEIFLSGLTFLEELPTILIEDRFISETLTESEMNFHSLYAV